MKDIGFITTYVGIPTFYNAPHIGLEDVKNGMAVVVGAPIDNGILFPRPGARFGPRSIREASLMYRGLQDVASEKTSVNVDTHIARRLKPQINLGDLGDFHVNPQDIMQTTESVIEGMSDIVKLGGVPILLGGDHYLAYPGFEGFARGLMERGENPKLGYVHIDSHTDFRDGVRRSGTVQPRHLRPEDQRKLGGVLQKHELGRAERQRYGRRHLPDVQEARAEDVHG